MKSLINWLPLVSSTKDEELSCSQCFDVVSSYVDLEISGVDAAHELPQVKQHLSQCSACRDEYEVLRDLRVLEEERGAPSVDDLRKMIR